MLCDVGTLVFISIRVMVIQSDSRGGAQGLGGEQFPLLFTKVIFVNRL